MSEAHTLGGLIRQHRLAASLSQAVLAERAQLSVATIAALERGRSSRPRPATVLLLAEALGLSPQAQAALIDAANGGGRPEGGQITSAPV
ncbi:MAG: helix-turn-helix domain-containing protein, partial [Chloroflexi bacterium]|nr:helix-turn-helix domain-containing protein [Chloroflexota bacterium]